MEDTEAQEDQLKQEPQTSPGMQTTPDTLDTIQEQFCDTCGAANPPTARFCQNCATLLPFKHSTGTLAQQMVLGGRYNCSAALVRVVWVPSIKPPIPASTIVPSPSKK